MAIWTIWTCNTYAKVYGIGWNDINALSIFTLLIWPTFDETTITGTTCDCDDTCTLASLTFISVTDISSINCICTEWWIVKSWEKVSTSTVFWRWARWPTSWRSLIFINSTWRQNWEADLKLNSASVSSWG